MILERGQVVRLLIALAIGLVLIGLIAWAGGPEHHRGDDVGALSSSPAAVGSTSEEAVAWLS